MATVADALSELEDIKQELIDEGSDIRIETKTEAAYDPFDGATFTDTFEDTKAFIKTEATPKVFQSFSAETSNSAYDLSIVTYSDTPITKDNKIVYKSQTYEIVFVSERTYINTILIYELLVRK